MEKEEGKLTKNKESTRITQHLNGINWRKPGNKIMEDWKNNQEYGKRLKKALKR